jgi:glutamate-1-semialdehyde 2,1-aminomutase
MTRASRSMPGGNSRTTSFYPPYPLVIEKGNGPWLFDVDGREYVDLFCNGLSLIHGNNFVGCREAIETALARGSAWSGTSHSQIEFAELLCGRVGLDLVRFTNSGSEACMLAVKTARHATGRPYIVKAVGAYHGSFPDLEAGLYGQGDLAERAFVAPFNDLAAFERLMAARGKSVAAIVIEPVLVTGRVVAPAPGFLNDLQSLANRYGALTILDDCLMLRLAVGGSAEKFDLEPDLIVLGKFLGGGTPLGAWGGSRRLMQAFDPTKPGCVFHGGSFNGNPIGCAAGLVTMQNLTEERIAAIDAAGSRIRAALTERAKTLGLDVIVSGIGSVAGIAFGADTQRHEDDPSRLGLSALFHLACASEGLLIGPGGILTVSTAHDDPVVSTAIERLGRALDIMADITP